MKVIDALKHKVKYPLSDGFFETVVIERGLSPDAEFTAQIGTSKQFNLARADSLASLVDAINVGEGQLNISLSQQELILNVANSIYERYGEPLLGGEKQPAIKILE
ncbi:MAG: hypothetical protein A2X18_07700 [Bacteroidetes bacterium GWF2_40_14]|nr:MAG: hypothetical protein A2X18_07700 [Bacteroidetes bacterium GWF2_40_14]